MLEISGNRRKDKKFPLKKFPLNFFQTIHLSYYYVNLIISKNGLCIYKSWKFQVSQKRDELNVTSMTSNN